MVVATDMKVVVVVAGLMVVVVVLADLHMVLVGAVEQQVTRGS